MAAKIDMTGEAVKAIATATATLPRLCWEGIAFDGYEKSDPKFNFEKSRQGFSPARVATAIAFLRECCRPLKASRRSSYGLKHNAENFGARVGLEPYVANGELIAAAVYLGATIREIPGTPNVLIGVKVVGAPIAWDSWKAGRASLLWPVGATTGEMLCG